MAETNLATVMHTSGLQDNGGAPSELSSGGTAFVSSAETATDDADLTVTLSSFANSAAATQDYQQVTTAFAPGTTSALSGVGQQAETSDSLVALKGVDCLTANSESQGICGVVLQREAQAATGEAVALSGDQVLEVAAVPTSSTQTQAEADYAANNSAAGLALLTPPAASEAPAAIKVLAAKLTGQPATKSYEQPAPGSANPCFLSTHSVHGQSTRAAFTAAMIAPAQACSYDIGSKGYTISTITSAQAASSLQPTDLDSAFATAARGAQFDKTFGPFHGYSARVAITTGEDFSVTELITLPESALHPASSARSKSHTVETTSAQVFKLEASIDADEGSSAGEETTPQDCDDLADPPDDLEFQPTSTDPNPLQRVEDWSAAHSYWNPEYNTFSILDTIKAWEKSTHEYCASEGE